MFFKLLNCKPEVKTSFKKRFPSSLKNCKGGHRSGGGGGVGIRNFPHRKFNKVDFVTRSGSLCK